MAINGTLALTKTMYNVCAHNSLPTSAILVLGLLKKKKKKEQFRMGDEALFWISGASQAYFGSLKDCYQRGYYCRESLYS